VLLISCPPLIYADLEALGIAPIASVLASDIDFLDEFLSNVNLKQIFSKLQSDSGNEDPKLDFIHTKIILANLRQTPLGTVLDTDLGIELLNGKTMKEIKDYLSFISLSDLQLLDYKAYERHSNNLGLNVNDQNNIVSMGTNMGNDNVNNDNPFAQNRNDNPFLSSNINNPLLNNIHDDNQSLQNSFNDNSSLISDQPTANFNSNANLQSQNIKLPAIKIVNNDDSRIFRPPKFGCFNELCDFAEQCWDDLPVNYRLMYQDHEGDYIRIASNNDIQEIIRYNVEHGNQTLKLDIFLLIQNKKY